MAKKIAFFLIMVMIANMAVWADDNPLTEEDWTILTILAVGSVFIIGLITILIYVSEAESPDDGIRLASMQTTDPVPKTGFGRFLNLMQHVEAGQTKDGDIYAGLRFRF